MKAITLITAIGILSVSPIVAHATPVFFDGFESDSAGYTTPAGFTVNGYGLQYAPYLNQTDYTFIGDGNGTNGTGLGYVGISGVTGSQAAFFVSLGYPASYPNQSTVPAHGADQTLLTNSNVGAVFLANTTYTLTDSVGGQLFLDANFNAATLGTISMSIDGNGAAVATQSTSILGTGAFAAGPTVTLDTALNPSLVGENIGLTAGWLNTTDATKEVGYDNLSITSMTDAVPEPSSFALTGFGFVGLMYLLRRKAAQV